MSERSQNAVDGLRRQAPMLVIGLVLAVLAVLAFRWVKASREAPPPRKVVPILQAQLQREPPPKPPAAPPPPVATPKVDEPEPSRIELKATDIPPPDAPAPTPSEPAAGPLALAAEGEGPGDAFNLRGNPGGRGLLTGGGIGDGSGNAAGVGGESDPRARYGWYFGKVAGAIEDVLKRDRTVATASTRVEVRVWTEASGRITRIQLVRSTGDAKLDDAIQSAVGLRVTPPPPADIPMPMILRVTARRPG